MFRLTHTSAAVAARVGLGARTPTPERSYSDSGIRVPQLASFRLPEIKNEPTRDYVPGSAEQEQLMAAVEELGSTTHHIPL
ncbi:1-pyrroline-5-carboxylate dehydrogenase, partial [Coemansia sp. S610]